MAHDSPPPRSRWEPPGVAREAEGCAGAGAGAEAGAGAGAVAKGETLVLQVKRAGVGAAKVVSADPRTCLWGMKRRGAGGQVGGSGMARIAHTKQSVSPDPARYTLQAS